MPFQKVFFLLINFLTKFLQSELDNLFKVLLNKEIPVNEVTKGAFSLARKKLNYEAFVELDKDQIDYFYQNVPSKTWHGFRLLSIDWEANQSFNLLLLFAKRSKIISERTIPH